MRKPAAFLIILSILLTTLVSCNTQEQQYYEKAPTAAPSATERVIYTVDPYWTPMPRPTNSKGEPIEGNPYDYINPDRLFNIGEWFEICDVYFRINSAEITDSLEGINTNELFPSDVKGIQNGTAKLLIINIDVRNEREEAVDHCFGNTHGIVQKKDTWYNKAELRYYEPAMEWDDIKHGHFYLFQPGEEGNFTLVEIVYESEDFEEVKDYFYIQIPPYGDLGEPLRGQEGSFYEYCAYVVMGRDKSEVDVYA